VVRSALGAAMSRHAGVTRDHEDLERPSQMLAASPLAGAGLDLAAIKAVSAAAPGLPLEVECDSPAQVGEVLEAGAGLSLLDNMGWRARR
jgi:hypothetical protein